MGKGTKGKGKGKTKPDIATPTPDAVDPPKSCSDSCSGKSRRRSRRLEGRVPNTDETDPVQELPLVRIAGYTPFLEPDGSIVYTLDDEDVDPDPISKIQDYLSRMAKLSLTIDSDPGYVTDPNDSDESDTPPGEHGGGIRHTNGRLMTKITIVPGRRNEVMKILGDGNDADYIDQLKRYKRYLRRKQRENKEKLDPAQAYL
jgi:hypothetical protein